MPYHWSENAKIGLSFLPEWDLNCAVSESEILMTEDRLNLKFPEVLRKFYLDWGNHKALTSTTHIIFHPSKCYVKESRLIFAVENQAVFFWGINISDIEEVNPPVYYAYNEGTVFEWNLIHQKVSQFFDLLLFGHAFHEESNPYSGGFGLIGDSDELPAFLESKAFNLIQLESAPWGLRMESKVRPWSIYYNDKSLLTLDIGISLKTRDPDLLAELNKVTGVKWQYQW